MLTRIRIQNYRAFEHFECEFGPRQLILGRNGAGKSSIFEILRLLQAIVAQRKPVADYVGTHTHTRWRPPTLQAFEVHLDLQGEKYRYTMFVDDFGGNGTAAITQESLCHGSMKVHQFDHEHAELLGPDNKPSAVYYFDGQHSPMAFAESKGVSTSIATFRDWLGKVQVIAPDPRRMSGIAEKESSSLDPSLSNFVAWYRHIRQETSDYEYIQDLQQVIPGLESIRLAEAGEGRRELKVRMKKRGPTAPQQPSTEEYTFSELSDGQRILIALYAILHFATKPGSTLCFDEPDNYLALFEIQPWLTRMLEKTEEENGVQVLIASHHPEIINWMAFQEGLILDRPDGLGVTVQPFRDKDNTGLTASELVTRGWDVE